MTTEWKPVIGCEGYYEVSSDGQVRSIDRTIEVFSFGKLITRRMRGREIKSRSDHGYCVVTLSVDAVHKHVRIHRLMLESFVGPCPDGMEALHANDTRDDNRLENLRWGTRTDNMHDMVRNGNHAMARKTHCKRGHEFNAENTGVQSRGGRACLVCKKETDREYYRVNRERIRAEQNEYSARRRAQRAAVTR